MKVVTFIIPPHLKFKDYVDPPKQHKEVRKKDGKRYGNLITDMPLGPLALSAFLKEKIGIQIKLLDFNVELNNLNEFNYKSFYEYFLEYFKNNSHYNDSDVFGISCLYSPSYQSMIDISKVLKKIFNNCTIMAGGNIPSTMYKTIYKKDDSIDLICYGEAEIPMLEYFSSKNPKQYVEQSNSWVTKDKLNNSNFKPQHNFIQNLDEIPIYDYGLCEDKYFKNPAFTAYGKHQETSANFHMLTSRGCPFFCIFCASHKVHGRKMRYYSIDRVKADLLHLKEKHNLNQPKLYNIRCNLGVLHSMRILNVRSIPIKLN